MIDELSLKNVKIDINKLLQLGFIKVDNYFEYETKILNKNFCLKIKIDGNNIITSDCFDVSTNEKFILYYVLNSSGDYINKIKGEYQKIIKKIIDNCTTKNVFKSKQSLLIIDYIKHKYNDDLEYLWEKFDNNAIWRNKKNNKWYGLLMIIPKKKLGLTEEGYAEIIDLRIDTEKIDEIIDMKRYFKGYHMNKKHWITIMLDESVDIKEIYLLIDNSYIISLKK